MQYVYKPHNNYPMKSAQQNAIVIARKKSPVGSLKTYKVYIDNNFVGLLKNGGTLTITEIYGKHTLRFDGFGKPEGSIEVYLQNGKPGILISATLNMLTGKIQLEPVSGIAGAQAVISEHEENVHNIVVSAKLQIDVYQKSDHVTTFLYCYEKAISELQKLEDMGEDPDELIHTPSYEIMMMKEEFQWHLCDAIARSKIRALDEIRNKYKNSKEFQRKCANEFYNEIIIHKEKFSQDSLQFADEAILEVFGAAREIPPPRISNSYSNENEGDCVDPIKRELMKIDCMEGHAFEQWCAELLRKNGFVDVEVTPGSGDQGVDVIAVKEGVRYAIQCKCYSSDLSNKPVQEVHTGKSIYKCQVGVVMTNRHFTLGAKEAAEATGVLLWDRDKLEELIANEKAGE